MKLTLFAVAALSASYPTLAQDAGPALAEAAEVIDEQAALPVAPATAPAPMPVQTRSSGNAVLPANTEVLLRMNQEVTTKGRTWSEGDTFALSVVHDVMLGEYVIIPAGSRAMGRITWMTNKGMFGKSGKMDVEIEYVTVAGRRIDLEGTYRQEGEGNTVATVAGVVVVPIAGLFITGRSGRIPQGRELTATTESDVVLAIEASAIQSKTAPLAPSNIRRETPMPVQENVPAPVEQTAPESAPAEALAQVSEEVVQDVSDQ